MIADDRSYSTYVLGAYGHKSPLYTTHTLRGYDRDSACSSCVHRRRPPAPASLLITCRPFAMCDRFQAQAHASPSPGGRAFLEFPRHPAEERRCSTVRGGATAWNERPMAGHGSCGPKKIPGTLFDLGKQPLT